MSPEDDTAKSECSLEGIEQAKKLPLGPIKQNFDVLVQVTSDSQPTVRKTRSRLLIIFLIVSE